MMNLTKYLKWIPYIIIVTLLVWTNLIGFSYTQGKKVSIDFNFEELSNDAKGIIEDGSRVIKSQDGEIID